MSDKDIYGDPLPKGALARLGSMRLMHPSMVHDIAFSSDGELIASCEGEILISEARTGTLLHRLRGHRGRIASLAFSADNDRLASVSTDGTLRLWSTNSGDMLRKVSLDRHEGRAVAYAGDSLIVVGAYMHVLLFSSKGKPIEKLEQCSGWITDVVCKVDARRAYVANERGLWRFGLPEAHLFGSRPAPESEHRALSEESTGALALSADGRILAAAEYGKIVFWDTQSEQPLRELTTQGQCESLSFSPDGRFLLACGRDNANLWSVEGEHQRTFAENHYGVDVGRFSPTGEILVTGARGGDVRVWKSDGSRQALSWPRHTTGVMNLSFSGDGTRLASAAGDYSLRVWDCASGRPVHQIEPGKEAGEQVVFSPRNDFIVADRRDGKITLYDAETGDVTGVLSNPNGSGWYRSLAVAPDGATIAACEGDRVMHMWRPDQRLPIWSKELGLGSHVAGLAFSPDGEYLAACGGERIGLWRAGSGEKVGKLGDKVFQLAFVDTTTILGVCSDDFIRLWDVNSGEETARAWFSGSWATLSAQGDIIALADDAAVHFYAVPGLEALASIAREGNFPHMAFSPDGRHFACVEQARNILIWDVSKLATARRGKPLEYPGAAALRDYRLVLNALPASTFTDVRLGDGCTNAATPDSDFDFLGIEINLPEQGRIIPAEALDDMHFLDPPSSPLIPMCGHISQGPDTDIKNVYVVAVDEATGKYRRGRLNMDRPTRGHTAPMPVFDDEDIDDEPGGTVVTASRTGSYFTVNLSEQVHIPDRPAVYRVHLEHAVVAELRSREVRVEVVAS